jgi:hypothetical protein
MSGCRVRSWPAIPNGCHRPVEQIAWCEGTADLDPLLIAPDGPVYPTREGAPQQGGRGYSARMRLQARVLPA